MRGADTARLNIAPEAAGLLAVSLGLSRMYGAVAIGSGASRLVSRTITQAGRAPLLETISHSLLVAIAVWMIWRAIRPARAHERPGLFAVAAGLVPCPLTLFMVVMATSMGSPEVGLVFALAMLVRVGFVLSLVGLAAHFGAARMNGVVGRFEFAGQAVVGVGGAMLLLLVLTPHIQRLLQ